MSKVFWISSVALLLLPVPAAGADQTDQGTEQKGAVHVEVQAGTIQVPGGAPVQVQVHREEGPGHGVRVQVGGQGGTAVQVGPIQVETPMPGGPAQRIRLGEYWLGLGCSPARGALSTQLKLPEGLGLVVDRVMPESPAARAEIKRHDVLLKAGDKPLRGVRDLIDAAEAAQGEPLAIDLIRGAKSKEVTVTPAKRPEPMQIRPGGPLEVPAEAARRAYERALEAFRQSGADEAHQRALKTLEGLRPGEVIRGPMRWRFFGPGAIVPPDAVPRPPLPGNMSVTITKQGDQPAKIKVTRGDQKWELTEDELDKLPDDVRPHIERMLGPIVGGRRDHHLPGFDFAPDLTAPVPPQAPPEAHPDGPLEKQLDDMNRRIERLRKSIEDMREKRPRLRKAPEEDSHRL